MYFDHCTTLDDLRAEYRRLIKIHHPDVGGDAETMKAINYKQLGNAVVPAQAYPIFWAIAKILGVSA